MGQYIFAYVTGGILLLAALLLLARPIKWIFRLMINSALGCIGLMLFNLIGGLFGLYIGVNLVTALTVGLLGVPGFALILILQYLI